MSLLIIFVLDLMQPRSLYFIISITCTHTTSRSGIRTPKRYSGMSHDCGICSTMPMYLASRDVNHVPHLEFLRLFPFGTNEARSKSDGQDLAPLVLVPEGAGTGRKAHVICHAIGGLENGVHMDSASESLSWGT